MGLQSREARRLLGREREFERLGRDEHSEPGIVHLAPRCAGLDGGAAADGLQQALGGRAVRRSSASMKVSSASLIAVDAAASVSTQ